MLMITTVLTLQGHCVHPVHPSQCDWSEHEATAQARSTKAAAAAQRAAPISPAAAPAKADRKVPKRSFATVGAATLTATTNVAHVANVAHITTHHHRAAARLSIPPADAHHAGPRADRSVLAFARALANAADVTNRARPTRTCLVCTAAAAATTRGRGGVFCANRRRVRLLRERRPRRSDPDNDNHGSATVVTWRYRRASFYFCYGTAACIRLDITGVTCTPAAFTCAWWQRCSSLWWAEGNLRGKLGAATSTRVARARCCG